MKYYFLQPDLQIAILWSVIYKKKTMRTPFVMKFEMIVNFVVMSCEHWKQSRLKNDTDDVENLPNLNKLCSAAYLTTNIGLRSTNSKLNNIDVTPNFERILQSPNKITLNILHRLWLPVCWFEFDLFAIVCRIVGFGYCYWTRKLRAQLRLYVYNPFVTGSISLRNYCVSDRFSVFLIWFIL